MMTFLSFFQRTCFAFLLIVLHAFASSTGHPVVRIFHLVDNVLWGNVDGSAVQGQFSCGNIDCEVFSSDTRSYYFDTLLIKFKNESLWNPFRKHFGGSSGGGCGGGGHHHHQQKPITVSLYNIHTWSSLSMYPHAPLVRFMAITYPLSNIL